MASNINFQIGQDQKVLFAGSSLNDDIYHTVVFRRRATKLTVTVDDDDPILGTNWSYLFLDHIKFHIII